MTAAEVITCTTMFDDMMFGTFFFFFFYRNHQVRACNTKFRLEKKKIASNSVVVLFVSPDAVGLRLTTTHAWNLLADCREPKQLAAEASAHKFLGRKNKIK